MSVLDPIITWLRFSCLKRFGLKQAMAGADRPRRPVLRALDMLTKEGYLEETADPQEFLKLGEYGKPRRCPQWKVLRNPGERPRTKVARTTLRAKIWKLIRAKRYFTKADLVITSGISSKTVDEYVRLLESNGYIRRTGKDQNKVTFMLIKDQLRYPALQREVNQEISYQNCSLLLLRLAVHIFSIFSILESHRQAANVISRTLQK